MNESPIILSNRIMVALVAAGFVLAGIVLLPVAGPTVAWGILTCGLLGLMLLGKPGLMLFIYWLWSSINSLISLVYAPSFFRLVDELLVGMMLLMVLGERVFLRRRSPDLRTFDRFMIALLVLTGVSALINRVSPFVTARFVSTYLGTFLVFYLGYYHLKPEHGRQQFLLIVGLFFLQIALNTGWQFSFNPIPNYRWGTEDFALGSFGSCDTVAYFTVFVMLLLYPVFKRVHRLEQRLLVVACGVIAALQLYITFTNHAYLLLVLGAAIQLGFLYRSFREYTTAATAVAVAVVVIAALDISGLSQRFMGGSAVANSLAPGTLARRWTAMVEGPKGRAYRDVIVTSPRELYFWPVGAGPGNFASAIGTQSRSMLAEKYINYVFLDYSGRREQVGSSVTQSILTGAMSIWSELGPGGFALFFGLHIYAVRRILRQLRAGQYHSFYRQVLVEALIPTIMLYLGLNLITDLFPNDTLHGGLWLLIASVWRPDAPPAALPTTAQKTAAGTGRRVPATRIPLRLPL